MKSRTTLRRWMRNRWKSSSEEEDESKQLELRGHGGEEQETENDTFQVVLTYFQVGLFQNCILKSVLTQSPWGINETVSFTTLGHVAVCQGVSFHVDTPGVNQTYLYIYRFMFHSDTHHISYETSFVKNIFLCVNSIQGSLNLVILDRLLGSP